MQGWVLCLLKQPTHLFTFEEAYNLVEDTLKSTNTTLRCELMFWGSAQLLGMPTAQASDPVLGD